MAERRMFSKTIISSAKFLRMPQTSRLLYYDLGMFADDDGVVEAFTVLRTTGAAEDDLRVLAAKGFIVVLNEDLVSYISDWKVNNYLRSDRYKPSIYSKLLVQLADGNHVDTIGIPEVDQRETQVRLGKDSIGKESIGQVTVCAEPEKSASTPPVIALPLNDGSEYQIFQEQCKEWSDLYPSVDVMQQLRNMRGWLVSNPTRRKTKRGIRKFINSWLSREQDRGGGKSNGNSKPQNSRSSYTPGSWDDFPY